MNPKLRHILDSDRDNPLTEEELKDLSARYPAFTLPQLMAMKSRTASPEDATRVAIALPDLDSIRDILGDDADIFANFYPEPQQTTPSTMETIDTFLSTYGTPADSRETDILTKAIFNPTPDYASVLAAEEQKSVPQGDELDENVVGAETAAINRFIASSKGRTVLPDNEIPDPLPQPKEKPESEPEPQPQPEAPRKDDAAERQQKTPDSGGLSESFARIMIKNRNYTKALEIISDLSLKNPEKSVYFADQIRFLRKLIVNDNKKQ